jgi:hypothetical protein
MVLSLITGFNSSKCSTSTRKNSRSFRSYTQDDYYLYAIAYL